MITNLSFPLEEKVCTEKSRFSLDLFLPPKEVPLFGPIPFSQFSYKMLRAANFDLGRKYLDNIEDESRRPPMWVQDVCDLLPEEKYSFESIKVIFICHCV